MFPTEIWPWCSQTDCHCCWRAPCVCPGFPERKSSASQGEQQHHTGKQRRFLLSYRGNPQWQTVADRTLSNRFTETAAVRWMSRPFESSQWRNAQYKLIKMKGCPVSECHNLALVKLKHTLWKQNLIVCSGSVHERCLTWTVTWTESDGWMNKWIIQTGCFFKRKSVSYSPASHDNLSTPKERCEHEGCWGKRHLSRGLVMLFEEATKQTPLFLQMEGKKGSFFFLKKGLCSAFSWPDNRLIATHFALW